jgi:hypothetical protein
MRRLREGAKTTQVITSGAGTQPATTPAPATQAAPPVAPDASVIEGEVAATATQPATTPAEWPEDEYDFTDSEAAANYLPPVIEDGEDNTPPAADEADDEPAPAVFVPPDRVRESAVIVERAARNYTAGGRGATEKQRNMIQKKISIAAKDDDLRHALLKTLTGFEHFGDISDAWMLALLNDWMKLQRPEGAEWPELCERAKGDIEAMRKALKK